jgi:hypothetical protein
MAGVEAITRLDTLQAALRAGRPRPDRLTAWYCASALVDLDAAPEDIASTVRASHGEITSTIGRHRAPTGEMRWAYGAILTARGAEVSRLAATREALRQGRAESKTGSLCAGGSRAALVMTVLGVEPGQAARDFFAMKAALNPPWWRRDTGITDMFAAAHVGKGDDPRAVARARERAVEVFSTDRRAKGYKRVGARACALYEAEPRTVLHAFTRLDDARRASKLLRHKVTRAMAMEWAAQGLTPADLDAIAALVQALPKKLGTISTGRSRLAHLIHTHGREGLPLGEITALAAIIAAQTAAIIAATSAATVATTAASS